MKNSVLFSCLFLISFSFLAFVSAHNGGMVVGTDWENITGLVSDNNDIYMLHSTGLWKFLTKNNSERLLSEENFSSVLCATYEAGYIYSVRSDGIYKTHISGSKSELISPSSWEYDNSKIAVYYNGSLLIFGDHTWKYDLKTNTFEKFLQETWGDTNAATIRGNILYLASDKLWYYNIETKKKKDINTDDWSTTKYLVFVNDEMYALCINPYKIDIAKGEYHFIDMKFNTNTNEFGGNFLIGAVQANRYAYGVWADGNLWKLKFALSHRNNEL